jgi:CHAT domain-containing protein/tetratricopeptide (TPR) repeat protein
MKTHAHSFSFNLIALRSGLIILITAALLAALSSDCHAQTPAPTAQAEGSRVNIAALCKGNVRVLTPGRELPSRLKAGDTQCWGVRLPARHFMHVHVEQRGIDIVVQLYTRQGVPVGEVIDSPNGQGGEEPVYEVAEVATDYVLAVSSGDKHPLKPDYTIKIDEWREAKGTDANFVAAARAFLKGQLLYAEGTNVEARAQRKAADNYRAALDTLGRALPLVPLQEDRGRELRRQMLDVNAGSHLRLGLLSCANNNSEEGLKQFAAAREAAHETGSAVGELLALLSANDCAAASGLPDQERALTESINQFDIKHRALALEAVGDLYWARRDFVKAVDAYSAAARMYHALPAPDKEAGVMTKLGQSYFDLGLFPQARAQYEAVLKVEGVGDAVRSNTKYNFGVVLDVLGDTGRALTELTEADTLTPQKNIEQRAYILHMLGRLYAGQGKYREALDLVQRALKLTEGNEALKNATAYEYLYLGFINILQGDREAGLKNTRTALGLWNELGDPRGQANALYNVGHIAYDQGDLDTALAYLNQALPLQQNEPYGLAYTLTSMASIHAARGNLEAARKEFQSALELRGKTGNLQGAIETLASWGRAESDAGYLKEADDKLRQAVGKLEEVRAEVPGADLRASYFSTGVQIYKLRIDVLMKLYQQERRQAYLEDALALSDRIHARSLLDVLAAGDAGRAGAASSGLLREERELLERMNQAVVRRNLLSRSPHTPRQMEEARQQVVGLRTDWRRLRDQIDNDARFELLRPKLLSAQEIKGLLDPETVMLAFVLGKEQSYLWVVSADEEIGGFVLPSQKQIEGAAGRLLDAINGSTSVSQNKATRRGQRGRRASARGASVRRPAPAVKRTPRGAPGGATRDSEFIAASTELSRLLFREAAPRLGAKRLVIVGDGILHYVPFSALTDRVKEGDKWEPLLTDHEIIISPSAAVSAVLQERARTRPVAPQLLALVGDPLYEVGESDAPAAVRRSVRARAAALLGTDQIYLPFLKDEVERIENLQKTYAPAEGGRVVRREEVSLDKATADDLKLYRIIHYATHGVFDDKDPETSGLLLSLYDEHKRPRRDGYFLSLPEVYRMSIAADLVVLSACQSALGPEVKGEGIVGLTRAFMHAGAARVVSSLWVVNDARTARLMNEFYRQMLEGGVTKPAAALREAQKSLYRSGEGPEVWAAFELQGEWKEPVRLRPARR